LHLKELSGITFQNELQGPQTCPEAQINSCYGCKKSGMGKGYERSRLELLEIGKY